MQAVGAIIMGGFKSRRLIIGFHLDSKALNSHCPVESRFGLELVYVLARTSSLPRYRLRADHQRVERVQSESRCDGCVSAGECGERRLGILVFVSEVCADLDGSPCLVCSEVGRSILFASGERQSLSGRTARLREEAFVHGGESEAGFEAGRGERPSEQRVAAERSSVGLRSVIAATRGREFGRVRARGV